MMPSLSSALTGGRSSARTAPALDVVCFVAVRLPLFTLGAVLAIPFALFLVACQIGESDLAMFCHLLDVLG